MNIDFASLDKSDFKCLKTPDGAVFYGQVVQILPPSIDTDKLTGFAPRDESKKPRPVGTRGSDGSAGGAPGTAAVMNATHSSAGGFRTGSAGRPATADPLQALYQDGCEPLVVEDISQVDEELLPKLITVRHGRGIQIQADKASKYAGQWYYGSRHGDGHLVNPDGSEYRGNLHFGQFNGYGQFIWPKQLTAGSVDSEKQLGHTYLGNWKMGMMHGEGQFNHVEGQILKPTFVNNLFNLQEGLFVNPFDTEAEIRATMDRIAQRKQKEAVEERKRKEQMSVHRVTNIQAYGEKLFEVRQSGRTPLVVSCLQNPIETMDLIISMGFDLNEQKNVWLRTASKINTHALSWLRETRSNHREEYERCIEQLQPWVMNLILDEDEEGDEPWPHHYDPDFDFLFGKAGPGLPETVWEGHKLLDNVDTVPLPLKHALSSHFNMELERHHSEQQEALDRQTSTGRNEKGAQQSSNAAANQQQFMQQQQNEVPKDASQIPLDEKEVMEAHLEEVKHEYAANLNFSVFSKTKFDENLDDSDLLEQARQRYERSLPLNHIDLVLVQSLEEAPKVEEPPAEVAQSVDGSVSQGQKTQQ